MKIIFFFRKEKVILFSEKERSNGMDHIDTQQVGLPHAWQILFCRPHQSCLIYENWHGIIYTFNKLRLVLQL